MKRILLLMLVLPWLVGFNGYYRSGRYSALPLSKDIEINQLQANDVVGIGTVLSETGEYPVLEKRDLNDDIVWALTIEATDLTGGSQDVNTHLYQRAAGVFTKVMSITGTGAPVFYGVPSSDMGVVGGLYRDSSNTIFIGVE